MVLAALSATLAVSILTAVQTPGASAVSVSLRGPTDAAQTVAAAAKVEQQRAPCQCEASNPSWVKSNRSEARCIFIDLGAAGGNSFQMFLANGYGPVGNCPSGKWEAFLVEANPRFEKNLEAQVAAFPGAVHSFTSTAAFDCEGSTSFYLDTKSTQYNYWGSSLSKKAGDVKKSGFEHVDVKLVNLNRLIYENTIPGDWVMVKMDIEGAEWDVLPCLAQAPAASLVDRLYMEVHGADLSLTGTTPAQLEAAKAALKQKGVDIPPYFSNTFF